MIFGDASLRRVLYTFCSPGDATQFRSTTCTLLHAVLAKYWALSMTKIDAVAEDEGLKESIGRYAINIGSITEQVYRKEMAEPIEDMKQYLDGILHLYDEGRTKTRLQEQFGMVEEAQRKFREASAEIAEHEGT